MVKPILVKGDKVRFNPDVEINQLHPTGHPYDKTYKVSEVVDQLCVRLYGLGNDAFQFERFTKLTVTPVITIHNNKYASKTFTAENIRKLIWNDEMDGLAPGTQTDLTDAEVETYVDILSDKTYKDYCEWRWPDNVEEQFLKVLECLHVNAESTEKEFALVYVDETEEFWLTKNLTYTEAKELGRTCTSYIVPMDAVSNLVCI